MRLCIDIDGTICPIRQAHENYGDLKPLVGVVERLKALKNQGAYIILCTARHMKTCEGNVGLVVAKQGGVLIEWLKEHSINYDELWFGKPYADIYIDDHGYQFTGRWEDITDDLIMSYKDKKS